MIRARDIWTAAFDNDVQRLRRLVNKHVPGGSDEHDDDDDDFIAAIEADADLTRVRTLYRLSEEDEGDLSSDADFSDDNNEGANPIDNSNNSPNNNNNYYSTGNMHPSSATARREAEEDAQEGDLARYRVIVRRRLRQRAMASVINTPGLMHTGPNKFETYFYGALFRVAEVLIDDDEDEGDSSTAAGAEEEEKCVNVESARNQSRPRSCTSCEKAAHSPHRSVGAGNNRDLRKADNAHDTYTLSEAVLPLSNRQEQSTNYTTVLVQWKPSRRSSYPLFPLHWAVLGRAHEAVAFLIANGADVRHGVDDAMRMDKAMRRRGADGLTASPDSRRAGYDLLGRCDGALARRTSNAADAAQTARKCADELDCIFPAGLTAAKMAEDNRSYETLRVLQRALAVYEARVQADIDEMQHLESQMEHRKARREKRRLRRDQRRAVMEEAAELEYRNQGNDSDEFV